MGFETIRAKDIVNYIGQMNILIVDLRTQSEYRKGHIPSAINIPYKEIDYRKKQLPHNKVVILYCDRGNLSMLVARDLEKEGYQVKSIYGGMSAYRGNVVR